MKSRDNTLMCKFCLEGNWFRDIQKEKKFNFKKNDKNSYSKIPSSSKNLNVGIFLRIHLN